MDKAVKWECLNVTDWDGEYVGKLGWVVNFHYQYIESFATIKDGKIESWVGFYLSADGEEPGQDTPKVPVDWRCFTEIAVKAKVRNLRRKFALLNRPLPED